MSDDDIVQLTLREPTRLFALPALERMREEHLVRRLAAIQAASVTLFVVDLLQCHLKWTDEELKKGEQGVPASKCDPFHRTASSHTLIAIAYLWF